LNVPTDPRVLKQAEGWARQHFPSNSHPLASKVIAVLIDQLGVSVTELPPAARFIEDLRADDGGDVEVVMALEETFRIKIPDHDAEQIATVGDLVNYLDKRTAPNTNPEGCIAAERAAVG
jgi:acyl carrier protein